MNTKLANYKDHFGWPDDLLTCTLQVAGRPLVVFDIESYKNFSLVVTIGPAGIRAARSDRADFIGALYRLFAEEAFYVGFNCARFDAPWINAATENTAANFERGQTLIASEDARPEWIVLGRQMIDLIDLRAANERVGLKGLAARSEAKIIQELPYPIDAELTEEQMDEVVAYCVNDCVETHRFLKAKFGEIELRYGLWEKYLEGKAKASSIGKFLSSKGASVAEQVLGTLLDLRGTILDTEHDIETASGSELLPELTFKTESLMRHYEGVKNATIRLRTS